MIKYGLKIWSNNTDWFNEALELYKNKDIDFIEVYHNPNIELDFESLKVFQNVPTTIHACHDDGFHIFKITETEINIWNETLKLADFLKSKYIILHTGIGHTIETFKQELEKIDNDRILLENMSSLDLLHNEMSFHNLESLREIRAMKEMCFDFEKAFKSSVYEKKDYEQFITECLEEFKPFYFHISGGKKSNPVNEHLDVWEADFDVKWTKSKLEETFKDGECFIAFEVPKKDGNLENDLKNIDYFKNL
ncbi:hypothetical protein H6775_01760 [Candidatus Nomurabacteria bacterium]|nr:hypothetical protein [Candidatus Nomurabacteria bacterium]